MKLIPLTRGYSAMVDDSDYEWLSQWKWRAVVAPHTVYAQREVRIVGTRYSLQMHRAILNPPDGKTHVDHIDGNGLNNCRENMRLCSQAENSRNRKSVRGSSSRFNGVYYAEKSKKWHAAIRINGSQKHLGCFEKEVNAAAAYNYAAKICYGSYAKLNEVDPLFLEVDLGVLILRSNNTSGFRGIWLEKCSGRWVAETSLNNKKTRLGKFSTPEEAARAYDDKAREIHGESARLNFP